MDEIRDFYGIQPGEIDVACFPLFALFNCAMGVTTVVPEMDFSRPATVDPRKIIGHPGTLARAALVIQEEIETLQAMRHPEIQRFDLVAGVPVVTRTSTGRPTSCRDTDR